MKAAIFFVIISILLIIVSCNQNTDSGNKGFNESERFTSVPDWSKEVVWYQIFVERFRNGDPTNDPRPKDLIGAYPDTIPENWKVTPWGQDWYRPDSWFEELDLPNFHDKQQCRRYGGDLQGVLDKLGYLSELGITAIYFNPLNDSPSLHKYDPRHWRHIDRNFGPDPEGDIEIISRETPDDPTTWKFTSADKLFLKVVDECKKRNIRVIIDYSWNHTGMDFWALNDVKAKGEKSKYVDWYDIELLDDPKTDKNEMKYKGWYGIKYLPEIKKAIVGQDSVFPFEGNLYSQAAKDHIFNVARRWLDPNGDGNPEDGVDGYRLDVAAEIPLGFWPEFREMVRKVNPEAYLIGEIWWQEWPDELMKPQRFLQGNMFDAIMNYRWYKPARWYFAEAPHAFPTTDFIDSLQQKFNGFSLDHSLAMMNLTASHDAPRVSTSLYNNGKYKFHTKPYDNPEYRIEKPDNYTLSIQRLLLMHQFTFIGAPHIWYGDEVGMWGADDPDTRKPMIWNDIVFEDETHHPLGLEKRTDKVEQDTVLLNYYKQLIKLRNMYKALVYGKLEFVYSNDEQESFAYTRTGSNEQILVAFNKSDISCILWALDVSDYKPIMKNGEISVNENRELELGGHSSAVFIKM